MAQGVTLVGGGTLPDLPGHQDIPEGLEDVIQSEGTPAVQSAALLTCWLFMGDQPPQAIALEEVAAIIAQGQGFVWIDASAYTASDLTNLAAILQLQRTTVHAMRSVWHRPWLAVAPAYFFVSATIARLETTTYQIQAGELDLCVGEHFALSAHKLPIPFLARVQARAQQSPELVTRDAPFLLYLMLDELLAYYEELNRHIQAESERLEERALRDTADTFLEDLLRFKRYTYALTELVSQHREVFAAFFRPDFTWIRGAEVEEYYRDLQNRLGDLLSLLSSAKDAVNGAFNIYVSQMTHRTNQIIKVLTMVSTIILPLSVVIALFGSSVQSLAPRLGNVWFGLMVVTVISISLGILWVFRQQQWLARRPSPTKRDGLA